MKHRIIIHRIIIHIKHHILNLHIIIHIKYKTYKTLWRHGVVVITTAQLPSTKPEFRFCTASNPNTCGESEICDGENL